MALLRLGLRGQAPVQEDGFGSNWQNVVLSGMSCKHALKSILGSGLEFVLYIMVE